MADAGANASGEAPASDAAGASRPAVGLSDEEAYFGSAPPGPPPGMDSQATPRRDATMASALANVARSVLGAGNAARPAAAEAVSEPARRPPLFEDPGLPIPTLRNLRPEPMDTVEIATPADTGLRACLATYEWPGELRVIIEMEDPDAPSLSAREHALWSDIALALAGRERAASVQGLRLFRFPPDRKLTRLQTPQAVREAVEGFLAAHQGRMAASAQLVFAGPALTRAFTGTDPEAPGAPPDACLLRAPLHFTFAERAMVLLPSLRQLLTDWTLKPVVWEALRPFRHAAALVVAGGPIDQASRQ